MTPLSVRKALDQMIGVDAKLRERACRQSLLRKCSARPPIPLRIVEGRELSRVT